MDPAMDDTITFARRLKVLKVPVTLRVFPDLPHGFLVYGWMGSKDCAKATEETGDVIKKCLGL